MRHSYTYFLFKFQIDNRTPQQKGNDFEITVFNKLTNGGIRATLSRTSTHNFLTDRTEFTGDGGIDIYASFHEIPVLIQCKCLQKEVSVGIVRQLKGTLTNTNQLGCIVSKNGFSKSAILHAENESQIILASENDVCSKIRHYYYNNNNKNSLRKTQEISNLEISLDNEEFKLFDFITISGKGKSTIRIGKMISYE